MSFTRTVETSTIEATAAPFPNTKGTVTIKVLNSDESLEAVRDLSQSRLWG
jgi:hypothetical protein